MVNSNVPMPMNNKTNSGFEGYQPNQVIPG